MELYIHIPFCVRKCGYCDFLSAPADAAVQTAYMEALLQEVKWAGKLCRGAESRGKAPGAENRLLAQSGNQSVETIFVGGGTPSVLEPDWMLRLFETIYGCFSVAADAEITMEANPGTLTKEKLNYYKKAGINRLSLGLQSMDNRELKELGRIHTAEEFLENFYMAREAGFHNINIDLMSALPGQTVSSWEQTLGRIAELLPEHISAYSLMIEEGTPFWERYGEGGGPSKEAEGADRQYGSSFLPPLPSEEEDRAMYHRTKILLEQAGYRRYEISNYARPGFACRHNVGYWTRVPYLGLGLGAASFYEGERFSNVTELERYLALTKEGPGNAAVPPWRKDRQIVSERDAMEEFMFLGLRLTAGIYAADFRRMFGEEIEAVYGAVLERLTGQGLLERTAGGWRLSEWGLDVSNCVLAEFLLEE